MPSRDSTTPEQLSDDILAARVARGDSAALEALYDRHAPAVLGVLLKVIGDRAIAEDALQETFWRVWKSASTFESERGAFTGWLFRIARNLAIDAHRRMNVRPQPLSDTDDMDALADRTSDPDTDVAEQAHGLSHSHRYVLSLTDAHHHSQYFEHVGEDHQHQHDHPYGHSHHDHDNHHEHSHTPPDSLNWRSLLALGVSGGLLPCPSALVVLLGAIALNRIGLGLVLVLAFSLGLAGTLTAIGMLFIYAGKLFERFPARSKIIGLLPVFSALFISLIGVGIVVKALMEIGVV